MPQLYTAEPVTGDFQKNIELFRGSERADRRLDIAEDELTLRQNQATARKTEKRVDSLIALFPHVGGSGKANIRTELGSIFEVDFSGGSDEEFGAMLKQIDGIVKNKNIQNEDKGAAIDDLMFPFLGEASAKNFLLKAEEKKTDLSISQGFDILNNLPQGTITGTPGSDVTLNPEVVVTPDIREKLLDVQRLLSRSPRTKAFGDRLVGSALGLGRARTVTKPEMTPTEALGKIAQAQKAKESFLATGGISPILAAVLEKDNPELLAMMQSNADKTVVEAAFNNYITSLRQFTGSTTLTYNPGTGEFE